MIKIALPTKDTLQVDDHFGHCSFFSVLTIENDIITDTITIPAPETCGCKSGIAVTLREMGVSVLLAGNMGQGAKNVLEAQGIKVVRGCSGGVQSVVEDFLSGKIEDSGQGCSAHGHEGCHHN